MQLHLAHSKATWLWRNHAFLQVFEILSSDAKAPEKLPSHKLKLLGLFKLRGEVTDLQPMRTVENPTLDYLLVSTSSAKVSCIRWDDARHTILTASLHYYEHALQNLTYEKIVRSQLAVSPPANALFCLRHDNLLVFCPLPARTTTTRTTTR